MDQTHSEMKRERARGLERTVMIPCEVLVLAPHTEVRDEPLSHVCSSVDVACLSGGVQPALAPRWTERAQSGLGLPGPVGGVGFPATLIP